MFHILFVPSFVLSRFLLLHWSPDLFFVFFFSIFLFSCEGYNEWVLRFLLPFLWVPLIIFQGLTGSLIIQPGRFAIPAVMGSTDIALLSQSTVTRRVQWTMLPIPGLEELYSEQSHNILTVQIPAQHLLDQFLLMYMDRISLAVYSSSDATVNE